MKNFEGCIPSDLLRLDIEKSRAVVREARSRDKDSQLLFDKESVRADKVGSNKLLHMKKPYTALKGDERPTALHQLTWWEKSEFMRSSAKDFNCDRNFSRPFARKALNAQGLVIRPMSAKSRLELARLEKAMKKRIYLQLCSIGGTQSSPDDNLDFHEFLRAVESIFISEKIFGGNEAYDRNVRKIFEELDFDSDGIIRIPESLSYLRNESSGLAHNRDEAIDNGKALRLVRADRSSAGLKDWIALRRESFQNAQAKLMKPWPPAAAWDAAHWLTDQDPRPPGKDSPNIPIAKYDRRSSDSLESSHTTSFSENTDGREMSNGKQLMARSSSTETPDFDLKSDIKGRCEVECQEMAGSDNAVASKEDSPACKQFEESLYGAALAISQGQYDTACHICTAIISAGSALFSAFYIRAESYRLRGQPVAAVEDFGFCLAINPASARAHKGRGLCLVDMGRFAQAAMHLRRARELRPAPDSAVYVSLGRCYEELGDATRALQEYDQAISSEPSSAYAYFCRGCCLQSVGEEERAGQDLAQVVRLDPLFVSRYMQIAAEAEGRFDFQTAARVYSSLETLPFLSIDQMTHLKAKKKLVGPNLLSKNTAEKM